MAWLGSDLRVFYRHNLIFGWPMESMESSCGAAKPQLEQTIRVHSDRTAVSSGNQSAFMTVL
jgi:hypothetical protein